MKRTLLLLTLVAGAAVAACSSTPEDAPEAPGGFGDNAGLVDPSSTSVMADDSIFEALPLKGKPQLDALCARPGDDPVRDGLCKPDAPALTGLAALQKAVGLGFTPDGGNDNPSFALLGHTQSLASRKVSAINPRVIIFMSTNARNPDLVTLAFTRGEGFAELIARDKKTKKLNFYLVRFEQACSAEHKCTPTDRFTVENERAWRNVSVYDDEDLANTIFDCRACHQPGGPKAPKQMLMQEMERPWTHFFDTETEGGAALYDDFKKAHPKDEPLAAIPPNVLVFSDPAALEHSVNVEGFGDAQPHFFDSKTIEGQVKASSKGQPGANDPPGKSTAWNTLYQRHLAGSPFPPAYHDVKVTDASKVSRVAAAYQAFTKGESSSAPDVTDVFLDRAAPELGHTLKTGLDAAGILKAACAGCHNDKLDPSLSRAGFDVTKLASMDKATKERVIARMKLPASSPQHMPPERFRTLTADEIAKVEAELSK
ncbi:MAG: hypothetical protein KC657_09235 [Myxococcales bacterium]|nr:hypothetical protein [Myxococcales bacterium]